MKIYDFNRAHDKIKSFLLRDEFVSTSEQHLFAAFDKMKDEWGIGKHKSGRHFISYITRNGLLDVKKFIDQSGFGKSIFHRPGVDDMTIFSGLKNHGYYTHYTALYLHQLTLQIPKTYYLNFEHYSPIESEPPNQSAIDRAFSKSQRRSNNIYSYSGRTIILLNGKFTNRLGVQSIRTENQNYDFTDLERTLIDCTIRPVYAGGVFEVLKAYQNAIGLLDPKKLRSYLDELEYIYPYEQCIGFYMERANYPAKAIKLFKKEFPLKFYLTYGMGKPQFSNEWNLYYPLGI